MSFIFIYFLFWFEMQYAITLQAYSFTWTILHPEIW